MRQAGRAGGRVGACVAAGVSAAGLLAGCGGPLVVLVDDEAPEAVFAMPDLDDDDGDGRADARRYVEGDPDHVTLVIPKRVGRRVRGDDVLRVELVGDAFGARLWRDGEVVADASRPTYEVLPGAEDLVLALQILDLDLDLRVRVAWLDGDAEKAVVTVPVRVPSLLLTHHLQPAERVHVVEVPDFGDGWTNADMVSTYAAVLGERFVPIPGRSVDFDAWVQDEVEFIPLAAGALRDDLVLDGIRDRELAPWARGLLDADVGRLVLGEGEATTYDSFGNLEVSPPVTVDGVDYPYGRVYVGADGDFAPHPDLLAALDRGLQAPIRLDTSWLCVGHVDEVVSTVPDPEASQGFRLVAADIDAFWAIADAMDPATRLPRYAPRDPELGHGRDTVGSITGDAALRALNAELRDAHVRPFVETLREALGVPEREVVRVPMIFEVAPGCDGFVVSLNPGIVNMAVLPAPGDGPGEADVFLPDPFFRADLGDQGADPLIAAVAAAMPSGLRLHWVDDWFVYHMGLGEVHCGTNELRTPLEVAR